MDAFIDPPKRPPALLRLGVRVAERQVGRRLLPARLLTWYPKAAIGSALFEALVAHRVKDDDADLDERVLRLTRIAASYAVACTFCIDLNTFESEHAGVTAEQVAALADQSRAPSQIPGLSAREAMAVEYARLISATPASFSEVFVERLAATFRPREIVVLASTAAQVNYWARLNAALGVPPAGFRATCDVPPRRA